MDLKIKLKEISTSDLSVYFEQVKEAYRTVYGEETPDNLKEYKQKISNAYFVLQEEMNRRTSIIVENINILK